MRAMLARDGVEEHAGTHTRRPSDRPGLAQNYSVSSEAVTVLLRALVAGNGYQAQFNHPELGGMGQWSQGGMIMIGDMFNQALKNKINSLCEDLSSRLRNQPLFASATSQTQTQGQGASGVSFFAPGPNSGSWWPGRTRRAFGDRRAK